MKFTITKLALLEALTVTGKCIASASIVPAVACYKFDIKNDVLEVTGGNMEVFITQSVEITGSNFEKSIAIPQASLFTWIKELADQPIEFTVEEREVKGKIAYSVEIVASGAKCLIPCEDGNDYPLFPDAEDDTFEMASADLYTGIDKSIFAVAKDFLKPELSAVNLIINSEGITFNGCDGHNMGTKTFPVLDELPLEANIVIPSNTMAAVRALPCDENVVITISPRTIKFQLNESTVLRSMLVDGNYPNVRGIIPHTNDKFILIDTNSFIGALKRSVHFTPKNFPVLSLKFSDGQVIINALNDLGEAASETIKVDYSGEPIDIRLNGSNILKCLARTDGSVVKLSIGASNKGVIISDPDLDISRKVDVLLTMPVGGE